MIPNNVIFKPKKRGRPRKEEQIKKKQLLQHNKTKELQEQINDIQENIINQYLFKPSDKDNLMYHLLQDYK